MNPDKSKPALLCVYYSLSGQTTKIVRAFADGFAEGGGRVSMIRLHPVKKIPFPFPSVLMTLWMMARTLFRVRDPVQETSEKIETPDLIVVGGPTWSFNPSGPVLDWLDREGESLLKGKAVLPLISCRSYWKIHWWELKRKILASGGAPAGPVVFRHPLREPWRSIGVFLVLMGRHPDKLPIIKNHFHRYGHTHGQVEEAKRLGVEAARAISAGEPASSLKRAVC